MANRWFLYISELAQKAQQEVTRTPENWQKFLTTASRFYKSYDFDDQLLIYIQRPDAVACADIETWNNKMHRWVNAGSNAIGLIRKGTGGRPYIQNVHDVSDTHRVKGGKDPWLWRMEEAYHAPVMERLAKVFGIPEGGDLGECLMEAASKVSEEHYGEYLRDLHYEVEDSFLEGLDDHNIEVIFRDTIKASVQYAVLTRCGLDASLYIDADDLRGITNFNNVGTLACLGTATAEANRTILMEIGEAVKNIQLEQVRQAKKILAKQPDVSYNKDEQFNTLKRERSGEDERIDIHQPERLSDSEHRDGQQGERTGNPDPVRQGEGEICRKNLVVVPNHLTEQWGADFLRLYPGAKVLVATKKDFEPQNRKKFCSRIATGDYDAVVIGHSQFEKIPLSPERQKAILREQIDQVIDGIEEAKAQNGERYTIKQLEKSRKSLQAKLEKLNDQSRKDDVVTFEELGVDKLFVDEAHGFKNLFLTTKMRNVAGIGQSEAQKSSDMFAKCRYLDDLTGGKGVVFATGTPVSNSMVELYTMMRYLQYDLLKETGLDHFDSWAAAFGETVTALELAPEGGGFRAKTRFAKFFNLPELMAMWKEAADIQTAEMLKLPVPASENITVVTKPSEFQKELVAELGERAEDVRNRLVEPREDNMLKITSDGRKLALDQRLAYPELPDDPESKVNACVGNVLKVWRDTEPQKGAQLVFCDLSTPHGDGSFNVYDDIKQKLMAQGVPPEQIAFIHDAKTDVQKAELFSKVRKGQVRVLLGSTSKMGAGTNVQTRLAALHHLDCPWRPADIEQREGRILRQGNQFKSVKIFKYVTEGTFDAYNWGLIENKQKFIGQLMSGKNPSRSCEDVDEAALSYAEVKALASGDPRIMEKTELDGQVTKLKLLKANHESQRYALEDNLIKFYPQAIKREQETIADLETDIRHLEAHTPPDKEHFSMTVMGTTYTEKKEAGQAIIAAFESLKDLSDKVELGEYRGFPMTLWVSDSGLSPKLQITLKHTRSHTFEPGSDPFGNITRMDNVLEGMRDNLEQHQTVLGNLLQQMEDAKVEVKRPFPQEAELAEKSERLAALNVALNIGGKDKPNSRERQKHDGKTSIKRLLRRMGVESAASAAPKKDKEMEVAI